MAEREIFPKMKVLDPHDEMQTVGKAETKVDAVKLVQGKPAFTADVDMRDLLVAKVLRSPPCSCEDQVDWMSLKPGRCPA